MIAEVGRITPETLTRSALNRDQQAAMLTLLENHFEGVCAGQFAADLAEKSHVILLKRDGRLVGFSTLLIYEERWRNEPVTVVYSGDTIVAPEAWNSPVLSRAWINTVNELRHDHPHGRYYWLLLTSGFRTYRFLPVFWREFYPHYNQPNPTTIPELLHHLAHEKFGPAYDATRGIVRFNRPQRLRASLATPPQGKTTDPHVRYFLTLNPGHLIGDELVCLTELTETNLTPAGRRMVARPPA